MTEELNKIAGQREIRRRRRRDLFNVALIGYTNVGKSSLLNALAAADIFVEDRLFATLDSTVRQMKHDGKENILLIDTVGFVRKLPHHLVASFKSTLKEASEADLLLHVVDCSHPYFRDQIAVINEVKKELQIENKPVITVLNKIDLVADKNFLNELKKEFEPCFLVSAKRYIFIEDLKKEIVRRLKEQSIQVSLRLKLSEQKLLASLHQWAEVLEKKYEDGYVKLIIEFPPEFKNRYYHLLEASVSDEKSTL